MIASKITKNVVMVDSIKEFVQEVTENKIDIYAGNFNGNTLLHFAAQINQVKIIQHLIDKGAEVNSENKVNATPLHMASLFGNYEAAEALIKNGAETNCRTKHGYSPLHYASMRMDRELAILLIGNGANPHAQANDKTSAFDASPRDFIPDLLHHTENNVIVKLDHTETKTMTTPRKEYIMSEIPFDKVHLETPLKGKMGRIDSYYQSDLDGQPVILRVKSLPGISQERLEVLYETIYEMQLVDFKHIFGTIAIMKIDDIKIGIFNRSSSWPYLRTVVEMSEDKIIDFHKVTAMKTLCDALVHIYSKMDPDKIDMEVSPDTIKIDPNTFESYLEIIFRPPIDQLNFFAYNPEFMAPERLAYGVVDPRSNNEHMYVAGVIFSYISTGSPKFSTESDSLETAIYIIDKFRRREAIYDQPIFKLTDLNKLLFSMTNIDPDERPQVITLHEAKIFSSMLAACREDENLMAPYDGQEEDLIGSVYRGQMSRLDSDRVSRGDDEEDEDDERSESRSSMRSSHSGSSRQEKSDRVAIDSDYTSDLEKDNGKSEASARSVDSKMSIKSRSSMRSMDSSKSKRKSRRDSLSSHHEKRSSRHEDRSSRHEDRSSHHEDRSSRLKDRSSRLKDRSSRSSAMSINVSKSYNEQNVTNSD